ncbi:hypothetical protein L1887_55127 [Cichorium endivia]|nr:hypothetical protein L1887_55127 [Cichorium endivia]
MMLGEQLISRTDNSQCLSGRLSCTIEHGQRISDTYSDVHGYADGVSHCTHSLCSRTEARKRIEKKNPNDSRIASGNSAVECTSHFESCSIMNSNLKTTTTTILSSRFVMTPACPINFYSPEAAPFSSVYEPEYEPVFCVLKVLAASKCKFVCISICSLHQCFTLRISTSNDQRQRSTLSVKRDLLSAQYVCHSLRSHLNADSAPEGLLVVLVLPGHFNWWRKSNASVSIKLTFWAAVFSQALIQKRDDALEAPIQCWPSSKSCLVEQSDRRMWLATAADHLLIAGDNHHSVPQHFAMPSGLLPRKVGEFKECLILPDSTVCVAHVTVSVALWLEAALTGLQLKLLVLLDARKTFGQIGAGIEKICHLLEFADSRRTTWLQVETAQIQAHAKCFGVSCLQMSTKSKYAQNAAPGQMTTIRQRQAVVWLKIGWQSKNHTKSVVYQTLSAVEFVKIFEIEISSSLTFADQQLELALCYGLHTIAVIEFKPKFCGFQHCSASDNADAKADAPVSKSYDTIRSCRKFITMNAEKSALNFGSRVGLWIAAIHSGESITAAILSAALRESRSHFPIRSGEQEKGSICHIGSYSGSSDGEPLGCSVDVHKGVQGNTVPVNTRMMQKESRSSLSFDPLTGSKPLIQRVDINSSWNSSWNSGWPTIGAVELIFEIASAQLPDHHWKFTSLTAALPIGY